MCVGCVCAYLKHFLYYSHPTEHIQSLSINICLYDAFIKESLQGWLKTYIWTGRALQLGKDFGFYTLHSMLPERLISALLYNIMHELFSICLLSLFQNDLFSVLLCCNYVSILPLNSPSLILTSMDKNTTVSPSILGVARHDSRGAWDVGFRQQVNWVGHGHPTGAGMWFGEVPRTRRRRCMWPYLLGKWFPSTESSYKTPTSAPTPNLRFWFNWFWITPKPIYVLKVPQVLNMHLK